jgi:hypothetical protein
MVISNWERMNPLKSDPVMVQFEASLKKVKVAIKNWIRDWKTRRRKEILDIESNLSRRLSNESGEPLSPTIMEEIKGLEERRNT